MPIHRRTDGSTGALALRRSVRVEPWMEPSEPFAWSRWNLQPCHAVSPTGKATKAAKSSKVSSEDAEMPQTRSRARPDTARRRHKRVRWKTNEMGPLLAYDKVHQHSANLVPLGKRPSTLPVVRNDTRFRMSVVPGALVEGARIAMTGCRRRSSESFPITQA